MNSSISREEGFGVEDDAVADDVHDARAEDADGQQVRGVLLAVDADGVAGVGAAAVADDDLRLFGEEVDDLALAFIAPLERRKRTYFLQGTGSRLSLSLLVREAVRTDSRTAGTSLPERGWKVWGMGESVKDRGLGEGRGK